MYCGPLVSKVDTCEEYGLYINLSTNEVALALHMSSFIMTKNLEVKKI